MTHDNNEDLVRAANRYAEGGRRSEDLAEIAQALADAPDDATFQERLKLIAGPQPAAEKN